MSRNQVVTEHRNGTGPEFFCGFDFEFNVQTGGGRKSMAQFIQVLPVLVLIQQAITPQKNIKLQIVVGEVSLRSSQYSPFPAAVTTAKNEALQFAARDDGFYA